MSEHGDAEGVYCRSLDAVLQPPRLEAAGTSFPVERGRVVTVGAAAGTAGTRGNVFCWALGSESQ